MEFTHSLPFLLGFFNGRLQQLLLVWFHVRFDVTVLRRLVRTQRTAERLLARMDHHVFLHIEVVSGSVRAKVALVRLFAGVFEHDVTSHRRHVLGGVRAFRTGLRRGQVRGRGGRRGRGGHVHFVGVGVGVGVTGPGGGGAAGSGATAPSAFDLRLLKGRRRRGWGRVLVLDHLPRVSDRWCGRGEAAPILVGDRRVFGLRLKQKTLNLKWRSGGKKRQPTKSLNCASPR